MDLKDRLTQAFGFRSQARKPENTSVLPTQNLRPSEDPETIEMIRQLDEQSRQERKPIGYVEFDGVRNRVGNIHIIKPSPNLKPELVDRTIEENIRFALMPEPMQQAVATRILTDLAVENRDPKDRRNWKRFKKEEGLPDRGEEIELTPTVIEIVASRLALEAISSRQKYPNQPATKVWIPFEEEMEEVVFVPKSPQEVEHDAQRSLGQVIAKAQRQRPVTPPPREEKIILPPSPTRIALQEMKSQISKSPKTSAELYMADYQARQKLHLTKK